MTCEWRQPILPVQINPDMTVLANPDSFFMGGHVHVAPIAWWVGGYLDLEMGGALCSYSSSLSIIIVVNLIIMLGQAEYSTHLER